MKSILATAALLNVANIVAGAPAPMAEGSGNSSTMLNLEARSDTIIGEHYCGIFANADSDNTKSLLNSLSGDGKNDEYTIAAHGCYRVACHNTSGVYVCNVSYIDHRRRRRRRRRPEHNALSIFPPQMASGMQC